MNVTSRSVSAQQSRTSKPARTAGVLIMSVAGCLFVGVLAAERLGGVAQPSPQQPGAISRALRTRLGAPGQAHAVVERSLLGMHSYMSLGIPSDPVRERVLSPELAAALGKHGRVLIANLLDHTYEVMAYERSPAYSRERFFHALDELNFMIARYGLGYYLYASFAWDTGYKRVDQVTLEPFAIRDVVLYRAGDEVIRALRVHRLGPPRVQVNKLGFTGPEYPEIFTLPDKIEHELVNGLWPARDAGAPTPLFWVTAEDEKSAWYRRLRHVLAASMNQELAVMTPSERVDDVQDALRQAFQRAVDVHEIQHHLDFQAKPRLRGVFGDLAARLDNKPLARSCMYETSAHLGQLARAPLSARTILGEIASYAFANQCMDADCLAALVILDEIGAELGEWESEELITRMSYSLRDIAERYAVIAGYPSQYVSDAAHNAWQRLFRAPLVPVRPFVSARKSD